MAANPPAPLELWSCNLPALDLFEALADQWRFSMKGPVGLDNAAIRPTADLLGMKEVDREMFADLRAMARVALEEMRKWK